MKLLTLINTIIQNLYEQLLLITALAANLWAMYYLTVDQLRELLKL